MVAVVGATATGKSGLGVALAARVSGEVVNADSMQLYRGMDVGTAKLTEAERRGIPHHLLDIWDVTETASVADYQRRARACISELHRRGITPLLVGGSGLYVTAVLDTVDFPGTDAQLRAQLESELSALGAEALHRRLADVDPQAAASILPSTGRRIVRALEVVELSGAPFRATLDPTPAYDDLVVLGLRLDRATLDERIAERVAAMWRAGFVDEVRELERAGLRAGVTASRALGYAQVLAYLDGRIDEAAAQSETVRATRRFARRQESWFGRNARIHWLDANAPLQLLLSAAEAQLDR